MGTLLGKIGLMGGGPAWRIHELAVMRKKREIEEKLQRTGRVKRSPNYFAVGCIVSNGTLVYRWGGLVFAQVSHDLQKLSVSVAMPPQYQYSCKRRRVYGADV